MRLFAGSAGIVALLAYEWGVEGSSRSLKMSRTMLPELCEAGGISMRSSASHLPLHMGNVELVGSACKNIFTPGRSSLGFCGGWGLWLRWEGDGKVQVHLCSSSGNRMPRWSYLCVGGFVAVCPTTPASASAPPLYLSDLFSALVFVFRRPIPVNSVSSIDRHPSLLGWSEEGYFCV